MRVAQWLLGDLVVVSRCDGVVGAWDGRVVACYR